MRLGEIGLRLMRGTGTPPTPPRGRKRQVDLASEQGPHQVTTDTLEQFPADPETLTPQLKVWTKAGPAVAGWQAGPKKLT